MKNLGIEVLSNGKLQTKDQALESSDFKTINSQSIVGSGDIAVSVTVDNSSITKNASDQIQAVALKNKSVDISSGTAVVSSNLNSVVTLTVAQYNTLKTNGTITVDGTTLTYDESGTIYNTVDESEVSIVAVDITLVSSSTTSGTLTSTELQTLQANNQNYIRTKLTIDNTDHIEIYRLNTDASDDGTLQYVHSMYENNSGSTKYLTITTSTRGWVITEDSGVSNAVTIDTTTQNFTGNKVLTLPTSSNYILIRRNGANNPYTKITENNFQTYVGGGTYGYGSTIGTPWGTLSFPHNSGTIALTSDIPSGTQLYQHCLYFQGTNGNIRGYGIILITNSSEQFTINTLKTYMASSNMFLQNGYVNVSANGSTIDYCMYIYVSSNIITMDYVTANFTIDGGAVKITNTYNSTPCASLSDTVTAL